MINKPQSFFLSFGIHVDVREINSTCDPGLIVFRFSSSIIDLRKKSVHLLLESSTPLDKKQTHSATSLHIQFT